ncbi:MAG: Uma2 family endonuclease [Verrucomicrobiota bacterium]
MIAVLETPEIRQQAYPLSVAAYHRLGELGEVDESVELIEGVLCYKMSKSPLHSYVTGILNDALNAVTGSKLCVRKEEPITLADSEPEPDLCVVEGQLDDFAFEHPKTALFVAEIAISSTAIDQIKANPYARARIPEYWLIRPEAGEIDVHLDPSAEGYQTVKTITADQPLQSVALPNFSIKLADILPKQKP